MGEEERPIEEIEAEKLAAQGAARMTDFERREAAHKECMDAALATVAVNQDRTPEETAKMEARLAELQLHFAKDTSGEDPPTR